MTLSALIRIAGTTWKNFWFNRDKRRYRRKLIAAIPDAEPLAGPEMKQRVIRIPFLPIQIFNEWEMDGIRYTILSRSHPKVYRHLLKRFNWKRITTNSTGSVVAQDRVKESRPIPCEGSPKIAIAGCVLTGFEHAEQWLRYYTSLPEVHRIFWYVNAPVAPKFLIELERNIEPLQLIPWDFEFKVARNHYLKTFQKGHALPAAYADSKFRAIREGCTHLMHLDMDEFIHPLDNLPKYATDKTTYFLSAYGRGPFFTKDGILNLEQTLIADVKSSTKNETIGPGTSGDKSIHALGKSIAPLYQDAVAPENHSYPTPDRTMVEIPMDTVMLHFLEMEAVRSYPKHYSFIPVIELEFHRFTHEHLKVSHKQTWDYITLSPGIHEL